VSPPTIGRFSFDNRILRPINGLRYTRQLSRIIRARILGFQSEEAGAAPAGGTNCLHQRIWRLGYEPGTGSSSLPGGSILSSAHPLRRRSPS